MDVLGLTSDGDLPPVRVVLYATVPDMLDAATSIDEQLATVIAQPRTTIRDLRQLAAGLDGVAGLIADLRTSLDAWSAVAAVPVTDGVVVLGAWRWERALRASLVRLSGRVQDAQAAAVAASRGRVQRTALVRSGDTWQALARTHLGSWERWPELVELNRGDPAAPVAGITIEIPER